MPDDFTLALPIVAIHDPETSPLLVVSTSPLPMRQRVEKIGRYFRREFRTDFPPMLAKEVPGEYGCIPYEAYLFFEEARDHLDEGEPLPYRIVGATDKSGVRAKLSL